MNPNAVNFDSNVTSSCIDCCMFENSIDTPAVVLELQHKYQDNLLDTSIVYTWNSSSIKIASARYYLTDLRIDTDTLEQNQRYSFVDLNTQSLVVGSLVPGNYAAIGGAIGVKSNSNHKVPNSFGLNHPLSAKEPSMFWDVTTGHVFMEIKGHFDNSMPADGITETPFTIRIGTDNRLQYFTIAKNFTIPEGSSGNLTLNLSVDYAALLRDLDINTIRFVNQNQDGNMILVTNNYDQAFQLQ